MKITESNYEEYFLLYIDDELTKAERNAVETFVINHPQYATELEVLQQAKFSNEETLDFRNKKSLYKTEGSEIGIDNYNDYFLLYTDNELSEEDKANTERFVLQHPQLQQEFIQWQQTKLPVEVIEFANKKSLYKKENRKAIPIYFVRLAAAAVVVTLLVLGWQLNSGNHNTGVVIAKTSQPKQQIVRPFQSQTTKEKNHDLNSTNKDHLQAKVEKTKESKLPLPKAEAAIALVEPDNKKIVVPEIVVEQTHNSTVTLPEGNDAAMQKTPAANANKAVEVLKPLDVLDTEETNVQTASTLTSDDDNMIHSAVYKQLDTDEDSHTVYVGAFQLNKAKVNGFLKSASHLLGSKQKGTATE